MSTLLLVILTFVGGLAVLVARGLLVDEIRGRIKQRTRMGLEATIVTLPDELQAEWGDEWRAELEAIIDIPLTAMQFVRGLGRSAPELVTDAAAADNTAPATSPLPQSTHVIQRWTKRMSQRLQPTLDRIATPAVVSRVIAYCRRNPAFVRLLLSSVGFGTGVAAIVRGDLIGALALLVAIIPLAVAAATLDRFLSFGDSRRRKRR